jgi:hypothetical protein
VRVVLVLFVIALVVIVLVPLLRRSVVRARRPPSMRRDELVKDPVCQTYVVRSRAITGGGADGAPYFCSTACARRYSG